MAFGNQRSASSRLFGEPSWFVRLSEIAAERGVWPVKFLFGGGENVTPAARSLVEKTWRAPFYLNYGQTESFGSIGLECREQNGYHRNDLHFLFEIADANPEGEGELIYTTLTRDVMPLIRYRSTDITRLVDEPCPCGLFAKRLAKIRARCDEMVVCGMGNVGPWVFAELLRGATCFGDEWQAVIGHDGIRDVVELRVETTAEVTQADATSLILANLRERFADFWKNLEMRLYTLQVTLFPRGSLRRARKLQRVVDQRQMVLPRS